MVLLFLASSSLSKGVDDKPGVDLSKIDRTLLKEPRYRADPKYCLVTFGPNARTQVWLVLDGDALYVDRNGNGNLTEQGERVAAEGQEGERRYRVGELRDGSLTHSDFVLLEDKPHPAMVGESEEVVDRLCKENPQSHVCLISIKVQHSVEDRRGPRATYRAGYFRFASRPQDAPVIHLGGPWTMMLLDRPTLAAGHSARLRFGVGTPGHGIGTFAFIHYEGVIPAVAHPVVALDLPGRGGGVARVTANCSPQERC